MFQEKEMVRETKVSFSQICPLDAKLVYRLKIILIIHDPQRSSGQRLIE